MRRLSTRVVCRVVVAGPRLSVVASSVVVVSHCPTWPSLTLLVGTVFCKNQYFLDLFALFSPINFVTAYNYSHIHSAVRSHSHQEWFAGLPSLARPPPPTRNCFFTKTCFPDIFLINRQRNSCEISPSLFIWFNEFTDVSTAHRKYPNILQKSPKFPWVQNSIATPNKKAS